MKREAKSHLKELPIHRNVSGGHELPGHQDQERGHGYLVWSIIIPHLEDLILDHDIFHMTQAQLFGV